MTDHIMFDLPVNADEWDVADLCSRRPRTREDLVGYSRLFPKSCIGKYVIARDPDKNKDLVPVLYLVDRQKTEKWWWSCHAGYAYVVDSEERARELAKRYKGTNVRAMRVTEELAQGPDDTKDTGYGIPEITW